MYKKIIELDKTSFIEVASRLTGEGEQLMIALRGSKTDKDATIASVLLSTTEVAQLVGGLNDWLTKQGEVQ